MAKKLTGKEFTKKFFGIWKDMPEEEYERIKEELKKMRER